MKFRIAALLIPLTFFSWHLFAQEDQLTPEQMEELKAMAQKMDTACQIPARPEIPDGSSATMDEMVSAQQALKSFIAAGNTYLDCLDGLEKTLGDEITEDQSTLVTTIYNRVVATMQSSATAFNDQLKAFREQEAN